VAERAGGIGIFDSGVGGLTVLRQVMDRLPAAPITYLGDTARVPYGTKSPDTVIRYARACASILVKRGIELLVVACNTASACALEPLRSELGIPVLGVVQPGAYSAAVATRNGRIGVIGTAGTIASGQYEAAIHAAAPKAIVKTKACPLFVPLAEEGWTEGPVPRQIAQTYLAELLAAEIDTLVLGCTHYPLLKGVIAETAGAAVALVDSAEATSTAVAEALQAMEGAAGFAETQTGEDASSAAARFLVTDAPENFARIGARFLGRAIGNVEWVDV
jgi:glutamate racemase